MVHCWELRAPEKPASPENPSLRRLEESDEESGNHFGSGNINGQMRVEMVAYKLTNTLKIFEINILKSRSDINNVT